LIVLITLFDLILGFI